MSDKPLSKEEAKKNLNIHFEAYAGGGNSEGFKAAMEAIIDRIDTRHTPTADVEDIVDKIFDLGGLGCNVCTDSDKAGECEKCEKERKKEIRDVLSTLTPTNEEAVEKVEAIMHTQPCECDKCKDRRHIISILKGE